MTNTIGHHIITQRIDTIMPAAAREGTVDVHASPKEIQQFAKYGYLVREGLIQGEQLEPFVVYIGKDGRLECQEREKYR